MTATCGSGKGHYRPVMVTGCLTPGQKKKDKLQSEEGSLQSEGGRHASVPTIWSPKEPPFILTQQAVLSLSSLRLSLFARFT